MTQLRRWSRTAVRGLALGCLMLLAAGAARAQVVGPSPAAQRDSLDEIERRARRARQGAGIRIGTWQVTGLAEVSGATYSTMPALEGYFQKGLDRHLAIESSAGLWRRSQRSGTGTSAEDIGSILIPMLTAIKLYPTTSPEQPFEPYLTAGVGFTIGVDSRNTVSGGLLGGGGGSGTVIIAGVGLKGGGGFEYRFSQAFGFSGTVGYQYVRFFDPVGGELTYKGFHAFGGMTYRFQY
ncbi:MAG: hypothetical protein HYR48_03130 [Gemmatimonadetes bacterium]|nr:hypothetical protein [Gemmatimonadota bacterium]